MITKPCYRFRSEVLQRHPNINKKLIKKVFFDLSGGGKTDFSGQLRRPNKESVKNS